eukprot:249829-Chlamydomonas_euryale.AAC.3
MRKLPAVPSDRVRVGVAAPLASPSGSSPPPTTSSVPLPAGRSGGGVPDAARCAIKPAGAAPNEG